MSGIRRGVLDRRQSESKGWDECEARNPGWGQGGREVRWMVAYKQEGKGEEVRDKIRKKGRPKGVGKRTRKGRGKEKGIERGRGRGRG